jgi:hypothetical protein
MDNYDRLAKTEPRENNGKAKNHILQLLREGKFKLLSLENKITGGKNFNILLDKVNLSKKKLENAKHQIENYGSKVGRYIKKNPKKSLAFAAAAGVLAGTLWAALKGKKTVTPKKNIPLKPKPAHSRL